MKAIYYVCENNAGTDNIDDLYKIQMAYIAALTVPLKSLGAELEVCKVPQHVGHDFIVDGEGPQAAKIEHAFALLDYAVYKLALKGIKHVYYVIPEGGTLKDARKVYANSIGAAKRLANKAFEGFSHGLKLGTVTWVEDEAGDPTPHFDLTATRQNGRWN